MPQLSTHLVSGGQVLEVGVAAGGAVLAHFAIGVAAVVHLELQVRADLSFGVGYVIEEGLGKRSTSQMNFLFT